MEKDNLEVMKIKDNPNIKLPSLTGGSYDGMDRLYFTHKDLVLKKVKQRKDNGNIEIITQAKGGLEEKRGWIEFQTENRSEKNTLYSWFKSRIGKDIQTIYHDDFILESNN